MTDLSLNPQLGARLKAVQIAWGHDTPGESLATILDSSMYGWEIKQPQIGETDAETGYRVRLKTRHVDYFTKMSYFAGCPVSELARSFLIKWLCACQQVQILPKTTQVSPVVTHKAQKITQKKRCNTQKTPKTPQVDAETTQILTQEPQADAELTHKKNGRAFLGNLMK